jgi:16S rRNA G966 N2-methylase RsmD
MKKKRILKILVSSKFGHFSKKNTQKGEFSLLFFFDPPFCRPETDKLPKQLHRTSQMTKMLTKKILVTLEQKLTETIHNLEPPPL